MEKSFIYCLHGFLGTPADWQEFQDAWPGYELRCPNLWDLLPANPLTKNKLVSDWAFKEWANVFNQAVAAETAQAHGPRPILLGYSLGGRLAQHALALNPRLWQKAVLVSSHPGLTSEVERRKREQQDLKWAGRFQNPNEEWSNLLAEWNAQGVFQSNVQANRQSKRNLNESAFNRVNLARSLELWSLARQTDLRDHLLALDIPILWLSGNQDQKFSNLAAEFAAIRAAQTNLSFRQVEGGHRLPWENHHGFVKAVAEFLL